jgi:hypothetical protein
LLVLSDAPNERNTMHELDVIADALSELDEPFGHQGGIPAAASLIADALVRASTVTTEAELNALPEGTVVQSEQGGTWEKSACNLWYETGSRRSHETADISLSARVLHRPV